jgi:hypothetical protein
MLYHWSAAVKSEGVNSKSELASASVSVVVNSSQRDITKESDPLVCEEHSDLVQPAESPRATATLSTITKCDEVLHVANTTQGPPETVNRPGNKETTISKSESSPRNKNLVSQSKGRGKNMAGKRKVEPDSKGPNIKQRSVSSFFKAASTK